jgi:sRNA-binding carbon storage regulator CsrA
MLVQTRKPKEDLIVDSADPSRLTVRVLSVRGNRVRLGLLSTAPLCILRRRTPGRNDKPLAGEFEPR